MTYLSNYNAELADEETLEEEQEEKVTFQYDPDKINIVTREPTIELLLKRINEEALDLAPDFQRHADIWKEDAQSRLIESIIIRIPIPAFYIDATNEDKWLVVDGLQRLFALKRFILDKKLKLSGLEYLTNLEGKTYDQIDRRYQRRLEETQLTVYLIEKGTPPEIKYNIFKRINTGGLALSPQELRHALNPGKGTKFLTKVAAYPKFQQVVKIGDKRIMRMDDREFILGFLAFTLTSYKDYADNRDTFLTKALSKTNKLSETELNNIENNFQKKIIANWNIFDKNAFRKISNSQTRQFPINKAQNLSWIQERLKTGVRDGCNLWQRKKDLFPSLSFCESVGQQIQSLGNGSPMLRQIVRKLFELENCCKTWRDGDFDLDLVASKVTPESDSRLQSLEDKLTFKCPDDVYRIFSLHLRMTGAGAWRLHFSTELGLGKIIIGYIGPKIQ